MSWRTIYISSQGHISYKNNFVVIRNDETRQIHISEINTLIIDNNMSTISTYLLNELVKRNVKVILCDEKHNPSMELMPYNASYESSRMIMKEAKWDRDRCDELWRKIVQYKIHYQSRLLKEMNNNAYLKLDEYAGEVEADDVTNREGHAAKVYFNALFGKEFSRDNNDEINSYLNYGYTVIMSMMNRAIAAHGYITQIGIHHIGPTNPFNLSCDLMEPFRPMVDKYALCHKNERFDKERKKELANIINAKIMYLGKEYYLHNAVDLYVTNVLSSFDFEEIKEEWFIYSEK